MLTRDLITRLAPRPSSKSKREIWDGYLEALLSSETAGRLGLAGVNTPERLAHLLAQWCHECDGFTLIWEDMSYSASRIMQIFGTGKHSAKVTETEARALAKMPLELAERVYGLGNPKKASELGNLEPGDGYRYRGFGIQQITGRRDHERLLGGKATPQASINAAIQEWTEKGCNALADKNDIVGVTRKINGGLNGLDDREAWLAKARTALQGVELSPGTPRRVEVVETDHVTQDLLKNQENQSPTPSSVTREGVVSRKPSIPSVAARSKSVWALLNAKVMLGLGFLTEVGRSLVDWAGGIFGAAPSAADEAIGLAQRGERLSVLIGFQWQKVAIGVTVACLAVALVRHIRDKRELETLRGQQ